jgi:hypothetical protein
MGRESVMIKVGHQFNTRRYRVYILAFLALDTLAVGAGMGVPIFAILFGFVVGWILPKILDFSSLEIRGMLERLITWACLTAGFTFLQMIILWGRTITLLLDPHSDLVNFGIPLILFDPRLSFIGWLVLMIIISPFLQLIATVFSSNVSLMFSQKARS